MRVHLVLAACSVMSSISVLRLQPGKAVHRNSLQVSEQVQGSQAGLTHFRDFSFGCR